MPSDKVLAIRSLEALAKVANGKATKIIIPSELQNLGGVVPSIKELDDRPEGRRIKNFIKDSFLALSLTFVVRQLPQNGSPWQNDVSGFAKSLSLWERCHGTTDGRGRL